MHKVWAVKAGMWCKSNGRSRKPSSLWVLNHVSRCLIDVVPSGCGNEGWAVLGSLTNKHRMWINISIAYKLNQEIAKTRVYISLVSANTSIGFCSCIEHTTIIPNYLDIMWLAQDNAWLSKTHPITYTTLYFPSRLPSAKFNCIIMHNARMYNHFELAAMAPKDSWKRMGKATARATMPTSFINWRLSLNVDHIKGLVSEHIHAPIRIPNVWGIKV